jgi:Rrf2 family protein
VLVTQKCQYALRALFELARRGNGRPVKIAEVAQAQAIPKRFLEVILSQLKQGGFVTSQRGSEGGYTLARTPGDLSVGEVIRFVQGPVGPVDCLEGDARDKCPLSRGCVFLPMWQEAADAISGVYDKTTFQDLLEQAPRTHDERVASYAI